MSLFSAFARWVSPDTIAKATLLLDGLPSEVAQPHISPSSDGEIGISWIKGDDRFEAMLGPEDHLVWITKIAGKFSAGSDVNMRAPHDRGLFYAAVNDFYGLDRDGRKQP